MNLKFLYKLVISFCINTVLFYNIYLNSIFFIFHVAESNRRWSSSLRVPKSEHYASDALIVFEFNLVETSSEDSDYTDVLQIATVQFNNLDVIGI